MSLLFVVSVLLKVVGIVLLIDFISGFFHWLEDAYGNEDWPIIGEQITKPNILHHHDPRYFTRYSWLYSARVLLPMGAIVLLAAYQFNFLNWMTILFVIIGVNANEIHKWAHRSKKENGKVITALQRTGILQSPKQHMFHHVGTKDTHYCVITDYLNPVLEIIHLWEGIEWIIERVLGVKRRPDHSVSLPNATAKSLA